MGKSNFYIMATYREIVYMCLDLLKQSSDDAYYTPEHVLFLLSNFRAYILRKQYDDVKKEIPDSNYQTICLDLEKVQGIDGDYCSPAYLRSIQDIPATLKIAQPRIYLGDFLNGRITYVSPERFPHTGFNKYLQNIIYCTKSDEGKLLLKSSNPQFLYLEGLRFSAVFEDVQEAAKLACNDEGVVCDIMDQEFPLEEALIPGVLELIVKDLTGATFQPKDYQNNASDDLSDLNNFVRRNMKSSLQKQLSND